MRATARALDPPMQRVLRTLAAQAAGDVAFSEQVRERSELRADRAALALDFVFGSLWYRLAFGVGPLDQAWADAVAEAVAAWGLSARP